MERPTRGRTIEASRLKVDCLTILDQVDEMKVSFTVTKHGRTVARIVPADAGEYARESLGTVTLVADDVEAYFSTGETWNAERGIR